ncbi:MAG TPA: galactose oxidase [Armatimonadota bacterium]|nr:galactose oxidase [Armatimonadota bacterium]
MSDVKQGPDWVCVNEQADWQARDSAGEFVFDNQMWILGGWYTPQVPNPRDVWKSPDGVEWTQTVEVAPWEYSDLSVALPFDGKMWFMGGRKLPGKENSNEVWSSTDGAEWTLETDHAGWCPRVGMSFVVFKDRMWVMAGTENFYEDNDDTLKNDVWSSADGKTWKLETENAGWAKRTHAQAVVFDGKIWIMGGGRWNPETVPRNDVWCSEDGVNWTEVTAGAPWGTRMWFSSLVYRDRLWVLGGWSRDHGNYGDVWYTKDGKDWTELKSDVIWKARHEHSSYVFKDKIWVTAGEAQPLNSEVWTLEMPDGWFGDE